MAKEGSTISGFADAFAQAISYALQYGVPLQDLVDKFSHVRFEPSGMTKNPDVRFAKSIVDYIFRWMAAKFLSADAQFRAGVNIREDVVTTPEQLALDVAAAAGASPTGAIASPKTSSFAAMQNQEDAPPCSTCGSIMVRSGACYKCATAARRAGARRFRSAGLQACQGVAQPFRAAGRAGESRPSSFSEQAFPSRTRPHPR